MMIRLGFLKQLYSLDTLDTRFTTSPTTPANEVAKENGSNTRNTLLRPRRAHTPLPDAKASRWRTAEYYFYYFVFVTIVPLMFKTPYDVSKASDPQYSKFEKLLSNGWIPGRKVDNSDLQYASFRDNIPYMGIVLILHPLCRKLYAFLRPLPAANSASPNSIANIRLEHRVTFDIVFTAIFLVVLHGFSALKVLLILYVNYCVAKRSPRQWIPPLTWAFNIAILFLNETFHGYPYSKIAAGMAPIFPQYGRMSLFHLGEWMDSHKGLVARWDVLFNITVLRLISFNLDYYWSLDRREASPVEKKQIDVANLSERDRVSVPAPPESFSILNYFSYTLYSPLYLAGPIITFNDYISQLRYPATSINNSRTIMYAIRFLVTLLSMELILHFIYAVAISKSDPDWSQYTPFQLSMLGYFNLHIIWLKLLLPWRFFRLWSLIDNVDPPENMVRCMSDNYSALAFWRGWHRSFNRWIVRYIYVPLGGSGRNTSTVRSLGNLLMVFTFVALWHDISLRLLTWSWLIVLFILPELLCSTVLFPAKAYKDQPNTYRIICGIGAVANILMMMAANLVGFALGLDGLEGLVKGIVSGFEGWAFLGAACATLFVGVMVMFEIREEEKRKGIAMKC